MFSNSLHHFFVGFMMAAAANLPACGRAALPEFQDFTNSQNPNASHASASIGGSVLSYGAVLQYQYCSTRSGVSGGTFSLCGASLLFANVPLCDKAPPSEPFFALRVFVTFPSGPVGTVDAANSVNFSSYGSPADCPDDPFGEGLLCNAGTRIAATAGAITIATLTASNSFDEQGHVKGKISGLQVPAVPAAIAPYGGRLPAFSGLESESFEFDLSCICQSYLPLPAGL